jgi:hypothetical protein
MSLGAKNESCMRFLKYKGVTQPEVHGVLVSVKKQLYCWHLLLEQRDAKKIKLWEYRQEKMNLFVAFNLFKKKLLHHIA